ncbi:Protein of unknown function [Streptomyces sp. KS_16]|nr:uncharacterized protein DUF2637 [Streptomyces sp. 2321.6]SDR32870.1 Protein of unknown function [Streptomyces sp. KS_16]SED25945.1 Protein of unknown function [Streptomyces sp. 2133.1]SNC70364.1 Protein of unknown function [Streptomyces sp. 2114.4]
MTSRTLTKPTRISISGTDAIRLGIALLAAFAFALSYDALRQMAVAVHIRGLLTYAFPLVIDGFIAIGVGALLMLRTAPTRSRAYVWALVGVATVTSIWANALHAVRLNQQARHDDGLQLDDLTVGALSAIAPLALAGAVHLYIVIRRQPAPSPHEPGTTKSHNPVGHSHNSTDSAKPTVPVGTAHDAPEPIAADVAHGPGDVARSSADVASDTPDMAEDPQPSTEPQDHEASEISPERLAIARTAPLGRQGRASRRHIEDTFRSQDLTIGRKEADRLKAIFRPNSTKPPPSGRRNSTQPPSPLPDPRDHADRPTLPAHPVFPCRERGDTGTAYSGAPDTSTHGEPLHAPPAPRTPHPPAGDDHHPHLTRSKLSGKESLPGLRPGGGGGIRRRGGTGVGRPRGADRGRGRRAVVERAAQARAASSTA